MSVRSILIELKVSSSFAPEYEISSSFTLWTDSSIDNYQRTSLTEETETCFDRALHCVCGGTRQGGYTLLLRHAAI